MYQIVTMTPPDPPDSSGGRGQVGIGTLIVFIAMVLVAAIAAGVLINTAGFLQSGAQETGQQSSDQVTNRLDVVSTIGTGVDTERDSIKYAELTVRAAPGAGNVDLGATTIQIVNSRGSHDLVAGRETGGTLAPNTTTFQVEEIADDDDSIRDNQVLNDPADRARITIDIDDIYLGVDTAVNSGEGLSGGETTTVILNTQSGGTTEVRLVAPETLSGDSAVVL